MNAADVLVVGGGPAGSVAALTLARAGVRVMVVERAPFPRRKVCGEFISATAWPLLRRLGVARGLLARAGAPVHRVGFFAAGNVVDAPMPAPADADAWGRAVGRECLDAALLEAAERTGARTWQPWTLRACEDDGALWHASLAGPRGEIAKVRARVIVAAHGSWERGAALPTQLRRVARRPGDLLGFKAHFRESRLPAGTMPLVLFPGGYGGLVATDDGRTSFSLCIRREALEACRRARPDLAAGEAVLALAKATCAGLRDVLEGARREGPWLAAGPIRPGIRRLARGRLFAVGNAAGEAHPLVAEGLAMAMQSAWLAAAGLAGARGLGDDGLAQARIEYEHAWRSQFAPRVVASRTFAALALAPRTQAIAGGLLSRAPRLLTWGARRSGKAAALPCLEALP